VTRGQPRLVGLFVLGALVLIAAGIAAMSARRLLADYRTYVVFFPYAVGGLRAGAPVTFRQVQVGHVTEVDLVFTGEKFGDSWIMAVFEIRRNALREPSGKAAVHSDAELARIMIESGLRASVRSSSIIAGQRSVDLDLRPDSPARMSGISSRYPEIPSAPTGMEVSPERMLIRCVEEGTIMSPHGPVAAKRYVVSLPPAPETDGYTFWADDDGFVLESYEGSEPERPWMQLVELSDRA
jgi:hypothetical protein